MLMRKAMDHPQVAHEILDVCLHVKAGERIWIQGWDHTADFARALAAECATRRCSAHLTVRDEQAWLRSVIEGPAKKLETVSPQEARTLARSDYFVFTMGPKSPIPWSAIPVKRRPLVSLWLDTRYDKSMYARRWARIAKKHRVRMLAVEATLATPERAKVLGLNYKKWRNVMFRGCMIDHKELARRSKVLAGLMSGVDGVSISTSSGTRLSLALDRRKVDVSDGVMTQAMAEKGRVVFLPAGAVEVSVDEASAEGTIVYDTRVRVDSKPVEGLRLDVREGRIRKFDAVRGSGVFGQYLKNGGRGAGRLAFLGFGLNPNLRFGYTQDDKVLGCLTLGFGDNVSIGGKNAADGQWWASITKATVRVGVTTLMDDGKILI